MRRLLASALAIAALGAPASAGAAASGSGADALTVTREEQLTPRLREYGLRTPALADETNVRVLLPAGYDARSARRYPVLYLLHGCCDYDVRGSQAWTTHGEVEQTTAGAPLIVVMPDGGRGGNYANWHNNGLGGQPEWETYHMGQLMPWVDRTFRTVARRKGRAIAGLSMGGFGAMSYASRHPDRFVAAASFSGIVDSNVSPETVEALGGLDGGAPGSIFGQRSTEEVLWRAHNPWDLAENLRGLKLDIRTGDGSPGGPYATQPDNSDPLEQNVHAESLSLHSRLDALGITHVWDDYGAGTHTWPYWARDLQRTLPGFLDVLAHPPAAPKSVTHTAVESEYQAYGWQVAIDRSANEFSRLAGASRSGFTLAGSGRGHVVTPAAYRPRADAEVRVDGDRGVTVRTLHADGEGRLHIDVPLGAANALQQFTPGADTKVFTTTVGITPLRLPACTARRAFTLRVPRGVRRVRATFGGRRAGVRVHGRRVRVSLRGRRAGAYRLVVRGRTPDGRPYKRVRTLRVCG
jgi:S-formylglutathione hydrolase FrmB